MSLNCTQRRIDCSSCSRSTFNQCRTEEKKKRRRKQSKTNIVSTWESSIGSSNSERNKSVSESSNQNRSNSEKDSQESMSCNNNIIELIVSGKNLCSCSSEFSTNKNGESSPQNTCKRSKNSIECTNILVLCRKKSTCDRCTKRTCCNRCHLYVFFIFLLKEKYLNRKKEKKKRERKESLDFNFTI